MDQFANLYTTLDGTTRTSVKVAALKAYFQEVNADDALWALWLLSGNTLRRSVTSTQLKDWAAHAASVPRWLFDEGYIRVGDLAEAVSLMVPGGATSGADKPLHQWMTEIAILRDMIETDRREYIVKSWRSVGQVERMLLTKLITGSFRIGVSRGLTVRAMADVRQVDVPSLLHALTGKWFPSDTTLEILTSNQGARVHPYPFFLSSPVGDVSKLGSVSDWQFEWKWDGIRGQIVRRGDETALWSRGEEDISEQFPEIIAAARQLPDGTVLDGEIMPWKDGPLAFAVLQTRLGRKIVSAKTQADAPVSFVAYDVLESNTEDIRSEPLSIRRERLEAIIDAAHSAILRISPTVSADTWEDYARLQKTSRRQKAEGLMIKRRSSTYQSGRVRGDWWKWKVDPLSVDAVMINAQRGHGRRSAVYSDYTFAVRDGDALVPFAKAYSGLTDAEIASVDSFVKRHTTQKFGPVRSVAPELVFEIGFEGIAASKRHKSGVAVRFPRILRPRPDKPVSEIDSVDTLQRLLEELS